MPHANLSFEAERTSARVNYRVQLVGSLSSRRRSDLCKASAVS